MNHAELEALKQLRQIPKSDRPAIQMGKVAIAPLGNPLPIIHQVLFI
ncbi:MAG: hypothetical protein O2890_06225 [Cyanobacteria bacterium]|nr:hypothetical protein [Cyanobacteriota bacterium]